MYQYYFSEYKRLGGTPPSLVIVGCEPGSLDDDIALTEPVRAAVAKTVDTVLRLLEAPGAA